MLSEKKIFVFCSVGLCWLPNPNHHPKLLKNCPLGTLGLVWKRHNMEGSLKKISQTVDPATRSKNPLLEFMVKIGLWNQWAKVVVRLKTPTLSKIFFAFLVSKTYTIVWKLAYLTYLTSFYKKIGVENVFSLKKIGRKTPPSAVFKIWVHFSSPQVPWAKFLKIA